MKKINIKHYSKFIWNNIRHFISMVLVLIAIIGAFPFSLIYALSKIIDNNNDNDDVNV